MEADIDIIDVAFDDLQTLDVEIGLTDRLPEQSKTQRITENGTYTVTPDDGKTLSRVTTQVSVLPLMDSLAVTANGEYEPANPYVGFDKVSVEVQPALQDKEVTISENGETTITADSGYDGLGSVKVKTDVVLYGLKTGQSAFTNATFTKLDCKIDTSNFPSIGFMFNGCANLTTFDTSEWNLSKCTIAYYVFTNCKSLTTVDTSNWDTSNITDISYLFTGCQSLTGIDTSNWDCGNTKYISQMVNNCGKLRTLIGTHTLAEVEAGNVVAMRDVGKSIVAELGVHVNGAALLRYSSILAVANGLYDRSAMKAINFQLPNLAFQHMYNDDDTTPSADVLAERQAKIRAICAEKNYTLVL